MQYRMIGKRRPVHTDEDIFVFIKIIFQSK